MNEHELEKRYSVTNDGRVVIEKTGKVLKPFLAGKGYCAVKLWDGKKYHHRYVHRLVAQEYCIGEKSNMEVNHRDGNKLNNNANNLEWVTKSENGKHAYMTGLNWNNPRKGSTHGGSKLVEADITEIKNLHNNGMSLAKVAELYPVTKATIWKICKNRSWRHANV